MGDRTVEPVPVSPDTDSNSARSQGRIPDQTKGIAAATEMTSHETPTAWSAPRVPPPLSGRDVPRHITSPAIAIATVDAASAGQSSSR